MQDLRTKSLFRNKSTRHPRYVGNRACTLPVGFVFSLNPPLIKFSYPLIILQRIAGFTTCDISRPRALRFARSVASWAFVVAVLGGDLHHSYFIISKEVLFLCTKNYVW